METVIEIGGWEHECCGPPYERDTVVELEVIAVPGPGGGAVRYVETHHGPEVAVAPTALRGRVAEIAIVHPDGGIEAIERLPGGRALRGFDEDDDGHLERPWTHEPVVADSTTFLLTLVG